MISKKEFPSDHPVEIREINSKCNPSFLNDSEVPFWKRGLIKSTHTFRGKTWKAQRTDKINPYLLIELCVLKWNLIGLAPDVVHEIVHSYHHALQSGSSDKEILSLLEKFDCLQLFFDTVIPSVRSGARALSKEPKRELFLTATTSIQTRTQVAAFFGVPPDLLLWKDDKPHYLTNYQTWWIRREFYRRYIRRSFATVEWPAHQPVPSQCMWNELVDIAETLDVLACYPNREAMIESAAARICESGLASRVDDGTQNLFLVKLEEWKLRDWAMLRIELELSAIFSRLRNISEGRTETLSEFVSHLRELIDQAKSVRTHGLESRDSDRKIHDHLTGHLAVAFSGPAGMLNIHDACFLQMRALMKQVYGCSIGATTADYQKAIGEFNDLQIADYECLLRAIVLAEVDRDSIRSIVTRHAMRYQLVLESIKRYEKQLRASEAQIAPEKLTKI